MNATAIHSNSDRLAGLTTLILITLGIIQIVLGATISRSVALTANGIDCIGDGFVSAVVWMGLRIYKKPANQRFNYGYYKMENLASAFAAIVMIGLAIYIGFRSYHQLLNPEPVELPLMGAIVASIAAIIAIALGIYKYTKGRASMNSVKLEAFNTIKDGTASALTVIALLFSSQGYFIADSIAGFIIAGIICTIGFAAIKESSYMLIDACDGSCVDKSIAIRDIAEQAEGVISVYHSKIRQSGPVFQGEIEIQVDTSMTIDEFSQLQKKLQKAIKDQFPDIERISIIPVPLK